jgi:hypothetical protein
MGLYAAADVIAQLASPTARRRIVAHWAMDSIKNARDGLIDSNELGEKIIARFREQNNVSFAATAEVAYSKGLNTLGDQLLELEEDVVQQVTTLLKLKQLDKALNKSAKSKDPDLCKSHVCLICKYSFLVFMVIRHLKTSGSSTNVNLMLQKIPHVYDLYKVWIYKTVY